jgi:hypothetical protein
LFHHTYSFDVSKFHKNLESIITGPSGLDLDNLHRSIRTLAQAPSETMKKALEDIRFDEEWVDGELSEPNRWYMIVLATELEESPNIPIWGRNVLGRALPLMNWDKASVDLLLLGKSLNLLPSTSMNSDFAHTFTFLTQFACWLGEADLRFLLKKLEEAKQHYVSPSDAVLESIQSYTALLGYDSSGSASFLKEALDSASTMVNSPLSRGHALLISSD